MYHISDDKRSKESSAWIYNALEHLMEEKDYSSITVTDICKEAKIGRVTFYRHYDTIDDVLRKKCDEKCKGLFDYLLEFRKYDPQPPYFIKPFLRYWYTNAFILKLVFRAGKFQIMQDALMEFLKSARDRFDVTPAAAYENYFLALRSSVCVAVLLEWVKDDMNMAPDELTHMIEAGMKQMIELNQLL